MHRKCISAAVIIKSSKSITDFSWQKQNNEIFNFTKSSNSQNHPPFIPFSLHRKCIFASLSHYKIIKNYNRFLWTKQNNEILHFTSLPVNKYNDFSYLKAILAFKTSHGSTSLKKSIVSPQKLNFHFLTFITYPFNINKLLIAWFLNVDTTLVSRHTDVNLFKYYFYSYSNHTLQLIFSIVSNLTLEKIAVVSRHWDIVYIKKNLIHFQLYRDVLKSC